MDEVRYYKAREFHDPFDYREGDTEVVLSTDYDALLAKYKALEASIPARERAAFMAGADWNFDMRWNGSKVDEVFRRYPDKEAKK